MLARTTLIALILMLLTAATARADFTGHLADLEAGLTARRAELASDPAAKKTVKEIDKVRKILAKENTSLNYAKEVKAASKIAKSFQKKLAAETVLLGYLNAALAAYREELGDARTVLAGLANTKQLEKKLKKTDKALAKAALATSMKKELIKLADAAKGVGIYVGISAAPEATWVVKDFKVATTGLDLDGNGSKDNKLASLGSLLALLQIDVQDIIDEAMGASDNVILIQMWDVDDWAGDAEVSAGLLNGVDTDGNPSDNFTGSEVFDITDGIEMDGYPLLRQTFPLGAGGTFGASYGGEAIEIGGISLPAEAKVMIEGTASPLRNAGIIGVSIPKAALLDAIEAAGYSRATVEAALNLAGAWDLFGGTAMSAAFSYDAVPAKTATR